MGATRSMTLRVEAIQDTYEQAGCRVLQRKDLAQGPLQLRPLVHSSAESRSDDRLIRCISSNIVRFRKNSLTQRPLCSSLEIPVFWQEHSSFEPRSLPFLRYGSEPPIWAVSGKDAWRLCTEEVSIISKECIVHAGGVGTYILLVNCKPMVNPGRQDQQVPRLCSNSNPSILRIANIEIPRPLQDVSNLFILVHVLIIEHLNLILVS